MPTQPDVSRLLTEVTRTSTVRTSHVGERSATVDGASAKEVVETSSSQRVSSRPTLKQTSSVIENFVPSPNCLSDDVSKMQMKGVSPSKLFVQSKSLGKFVNLYSIIYLTVNSV